MNIQPIAETVVNPNNTAAVYWVAMIALIIGGVIWSCVGDWIKKNRRGR